MNSANKLTVGLIAASLVAVAIGAIVVRQAMNLSSARIVVVPPVQRDDALPSTDPSVLPPAVVDDAPVATAQPAPPESVAPMIAESSPFQSIPNASAQRAKPKASPAQPMPPDDRPVGRQALSFVGADPAAEAIWVQSINDPNTSAHDRQDLIEDLNEDGFPDPHNVTADDLPLIENRLALIEQLAPQSMDDVNAAAFAEAYKDLTNMRARATNP